ncbi:cytochrome P450 6A1-like [Neodiprion lecontei]|uniref:Cytochrome P450 6A1-like n=1 Tax=Neodiprion lecontei TaxID=441921 RepID=A0ABM3GNI5_NEOLC|nr:cytochrome P450 6A1-like [Neodiprion lecontei]
MMHKPVLVVKDPNLIRFVLTKKFAHFQDRGIYCNEKIDPLSAHLLSVPGEKWRFLMSKFSPAFTSSKIKQIFFTVGECFEKMVDFIAEKAKNRELVEVQELFARFSTDVIASAAFGIQVNSIENPNAEFRKWGRKFFQPNPLRNLLLLMVPSWLDLFKIPVTSKNITKFFIGSFTESVEYRIANNVARKDFLDLLMQLMDKGYIDNDDEKTSNQMSGFNRVKIIMLEGAAHAFVFWLGRFETSSTTATNCLYELAVHQDIYHNI